jgi:saccharopine dehydrogenase (NAD+, L-lysine-forming)
MARALIVGAGGVGSVVAHKCAQVPEVFSDLMLASRSIGKCRAIQEQLGGKIDIAQVDADRVPEVVALIERFRPDILINTALPYQDLTLMDACLATGTDYLDTANYEPPDDPHFEYRWQWEYRDRFRERGLMAVLGCGFDPGVTNVFCAWAAKHHFDSIRTVDILDCNAGSHGRPFAPNFNPEINIREVTQVVRHWDKGRWVQTPPILEEGCVHIPFDYPEVGVKESYLLYHEELESLAKNLPGLARIRFWMTFSDNYLTHLRVLQNVGMTRIDPVVYEGREIVPLKFLKVLLPEPADLAKNYTGKTSIGCNITGSQGGGAERTIFIYNVCDHAETYREVGAHAVSYTTGVPAMIGAMMVLTGRWAGNGVFNVEELDPDPFMDALGRHGLPWVCEDSSPLP